MKKAAALLIALVVSALLPSVSAQTETCDGNFHVVHDVSDGELNDVDIAPGGRGWAVGFDYENDEDRSISALTHGPYERPWVVRFDDNDFEEITPPHEPGTELDAVDALADDDVWAVGQFLPTYKSGNAIAYHWDGTAWSQMTVSRRGQYGDLRGVVAVAPNDIWAVGFYERYDDRGVKTLIAHYDGSTWTHVPAPSPAKVSVLNDVDATAPDSVWAVGEWKWSHPLVLRFDGTEWRHLKLGRMFRGDGQQFYAVDAVGPDDVWASGHSSLVVHRVNGKWRVEETPNARGTEVIRGIAADGDEVWAVGMRFVPDTPYTWAMHKENGEWSRVSFEGQPTGDVHNVALDETGTAWAVGDTFDPDGTDEQGEVIERACTP